MLKDGDRAPVVKGRNADILVSRELVGRGCCLFWGPRDWLEEPISFLVFALEARVTAI